MPSSPNYKRNYKQEYDLFADSTKAKKIERQETKLLELRVLDLLM